MAALSDIANRLADGAKAMLHTAWRIALRDTPFFGRLDWRRRDVVGRATLETLVTVVLSALPLLFAIAIVAFPTQDFAIAIEPVAGNGEWFLLSASTVGPLVYVVSVVYHRRDRTFLTSFPHGTYYGLFAVAILMTSATVITLRSLADKAGVEPAMLNMTSYTDVSFSIYLIAVIVYFTAAMHRNAAESQDASDLNRSAEEAFQAEWDARK